MQENIVKKMFCDKEKNLKSNSKLSRRISEYQTVPTILQSILAKFSKVLPSQPKSRMPKSMMPARTQGRRKDTLKLSKITKILENAQKFPKVSKSIQKYPQVSNSSQKHP